MNRRQFGTGSLSTAATLAVDPNSATTLVQALGKLSSTDFRILALWSRCSWHGNYAISGPAVISDPINEMVNRTIVTSDIRSALGIAMDPDKPFVLSTSQFELLRAYLVTGDAVRQQIFMGHPRSAKARGQCYMQTLGELRKFVSVGELQAIKSTSVFQEVFFGSEGSTGFCGNMEVDAGVFERACREVCRVAGLSEEAFDQLKHEHMSQYTKDRLATVFDDGLVGVTIRQGNALLGPQSPGVALSSPESQRIILA